MRKEFLSISAILASTALFIAGTGLLGTLIPVRAHLEGFSTLSIGVIGSFYFAGFAFGCFLGPRLLARAGHARAFAVAAGILTAMTLIQAMLVSVTAWLIARALFGMGAACLYMIIESWLNDRASNETRGKIFSAYLLVNFSALIVGQMLFATARPMSFALFNLAAIFFAVCLIPMGITRLPQPAPAAIPTLRPSKLFATSPVGFAGVIGVGLANGAVWTLAPVYAQHHGLAKGMLAVFMSAFTLGGALIQLPIGRFSDRLDRRIIIAGATFAAAALGIALYLFGGGGPQWRVLVLIGLFGTVSLPLYGLSVAHANDRVARENFVETSATLLLLNAAASVLGPTLGALVTTRFGTAALFLYTAAIHAAMCGFTIVRLRMKDRPESETREPFEPMPQQSTAALAELDPRGNPA